MNPINAIKKAILLSFAIVSIIILLPSGYLLAGDPPYSNVLKLDGIDDFAGALNRSDNTVGTATFIYELWFKINTLPNTDVDKKFLFSKQNSLSLFIEQDSGAIKLSSNIFGVSYIRPGSATSISTGTWYHATLRRVGDTVATFLDGTQVATYTGSASFAIPDPSNALLVGSDAKDGTTQTFFNGAIDEFRLRKGGDYSGAITKPTAVFACADNTDTYALWHFNEAVSSTNGPFIDINCNPPVGQNEKLFGSGSVVTLITLDSFTATLSDDGKITLNWKTATENNNAGFYILRSASMNSGYERISPLKPGNGDTATGASYSYVDESAEPGRLYFYKLEDIDLVSGSHINDEIASLIWDSNCKLQLSTSPAFSCMKNNTLTVSNSKKAANKNKAINKWLNKKGKGSNIYWRIKGKKSGKMS